MSFWRPEFEFIRANRLVFDETPSPGPAAGAPEAPPSAPEAPETPTTSPETPKEKPDTGAQLDTLSADAEATRKTAIIEHWKEKGVGNKNESKEDQGEDLDVMSAAKKNPGAFALVMLVVDGDFEKSKKFLNSNTGEFDMFKIVEEYTEEKTKKTYGFYYDGKEWTAYDAGLASDNEYGGDFLTAWPKIVNFMKYEDYDEFNNVPAQKAVIKNIASYIDMAGGSVSYSDGGDVAKEGITEGQEGLKRASFNIVNWFKQNASDKLVSVFESEPWKAARAKFLSENEGLYKYFYDNGSNKIYALGIAGTSVAGKVRELEAKDGVNWKTDWTEVTDPKPIFEKVYDKMDNASRTGAQTEIWSEGGEVNEAMADHFTREYKGDFTFKLSDQIKSQEDLAGKLKTWLEGRKSRDVGLGKLNLEQIGKIADIKAEFLVKTTLEKIKEKHPPKEFDDATFADSEFLVNFIGGAFKELRLTAGTFLKNAAEAAKGAGTAAADALDADGKAFVAKYAESFGGTAEAAKFYAGFAKWPFGLGPMVAGILASIAGPFMKKIKGGIKGVAEKVGRQTGVEVGVGASATILKQKELDSPGRLKDPKYILDEEVKLKRKVKITKLTVTTESTDLIVSERKLFLKKDGVMESDKGTVFEKGTILPKGSTLEGVEVLADEAPAAASTPAPSQTT